MEKCSEAPRQEAMCSTGNGKAIVVQYGARRMYAVPSVLAHAGRLERFYTDFALNEAFGKFVKPLAGVVAPRAKAALERRTLPANLSNKTTIFPRWTFGLSRGTKNSDPVERIRAMEHAHRQAGRAMRKNGVHDATHVLSIFGEGREFLLLAKEKGLDVCVDVNIAFSTEEILADASERFPGWGQPYVFEGEAKSESESIRKFILDIADKLFCPSQFVADDLIENYGVSPSKIRLVPYTVSDYWFEQENNAVPGRVLFAGSPSLRKGIHILAEAAQKLKIRAPACEVLIAGNASSEMINRAECSALTFLGALSHAKLREEMSRSDVFCFPSLSEGAAAVTFEALAAGLPLITTHASGSVVEHGKSGLIIPPNDVDALVEAVVKIVQNRSKQKAMAREAKTRAYEFTWDKYESRLLNALFD